MTSPNPYTGKVRLYGWQNGLLMGFVIGSIVSVLVTGEFETAGLLLLSVLVGTTYWHILPTVRFYLD